MDLLLAIGISRAWAIAEIDYRLNHATLSIDVSKIGNT